MSSVDNGQVLGVTAAATGIAVIGVNTQTALFVAALGLAVIVLITLFKKKNNSN